MFLLTLGTGLQDFRCASSVWSIVPTAASYDEMVISNATALEEGVLCDSQPFQPAGATVVHVEATRKNNFISLRTA